MGPVGQNQARLYVCQVVVAVKCKNNYSFWSSSSAIGTGGKVCHLWLTYQFGAAFSKVPRKILGKLLILGATDTQVATSFRGYNATVKHCTNRPINSVHWSNRKLCSSSSSSSSNSSSKIRSFPKIFLGTFENAAPAPYGQGSQSWPTHTQTTL